MYRTRLFDLEEDSLHFFWDDWTCYPCAINGDDVQHSYPCDLNNLITVYGVYIEAKLLLPSILSIDQHKCMCVYTYPIRLFISVDLTKQKNFVTNLIGML